MSVISWLQLLGLGTLCSLIVTTLFTVVKEHVGQNSRKKREERLKPLIEMGTKIDKISEQVEHIEQRKEISDKAIQAILRNKLYELYNKGLEDGYATVEAKENFENMYQQYHALGKNGVMDEIREKYLDLPERSFK